MSDAEIFQAAKLLADELATQWDATFAVVEIRGEGIPVKVKEAPDPRLHFEIRVRGGGITILCRTATAHGWHRIRNRAKRPWRGFAVTITFEPLKLSDGNYHTPVRVRAVRP